MTEEISAKGDRSISIGGDVTDSVIITGNITGDVQIYRRLPTGAPFQAPPLPPHFVPRPEVSDTLKAHLLTNDAAGTGVLVVSAIHGLGGIGKSVLAAALAHESEVQQRFPDGILWSTIGQQPDILSLLSGWVQALGDYDFRPTTIEAASAHLRTLLHKKAALLVVDDVWDPAHALQFQIGGPRCQVLMTTRRADVADEMGADLYQLDVMTPEQSLSLLAARLGHALEETERDKALRLVEAVGYLPLALELAAARVARGVAWEILREALEEEIARLEALEGPRRRRMVRPRLEASFNLSLDSLRTDDEAAWERFVWLGVLPEDVLIAAPMVATLWEMDESEAAEMLELMWNDALLLPGPPVWVGERSYRTYRLHDLLHDVACRLLIKKLPQGLGFALKDAHIVLLERYRKQTKDGLWHTLPDDSYIHTYLAWHMEQARQFEQIHILLQEETTEGSNAWYTCRERLGQTAGYLNDVERAWRLSEEELINRQSPSSIGLQCRYALIISSVNTMVRKLPPKLLASLVKERVWTPIQGLAYARQSPDPEQHVEALTALIPYLPAGLRAEVFLEVLLTAWEIEDDYDLSLLPYNLAVGLLGETQAKGRIGWSSDWANLLELLSPHLPEVILRKILLATRLIKHTGKQAWVLERLVPHVPPTLLGDILAEVRRIDDTDLRASVLASLVPYMPPSLREQVANETLKALPEIQDIEHKAELLEELVLGLPAELFRKTLATVREIEDTNTLTELLTDLAFKSAIWHDYIEGAVIATREIEDSNIRTEVLTELASGLVARNKFEEALAMAQEIQDTDDRARVLAMLTSQQSVVGHHQEVPTSAQNIEDTSDRVKESAKLKSESVFSDRLEDVPTVGENGDKDDQIQTLVENGIKSTTLGYTEKDLREAREIRYGYEKGLALERIARHIPEELLEETLETVREIDWDAHQAPALGALVSRLIELGWIERALAVAREIGPDDWKSSALGSLGPHLPDELLKEVLAVARGIEVPYQTHLLAELVPYLSRDLLKEALVVAREIRDTDNRTMIQVGLAPHLPRKYLNDILKATRKIEDRYLRAKSLIRLFPSLPAVSLSEALVAAQEISDIESETEVFTNLIPYLPTELLDDALVAVREIEDIYDRANVLTVLLKRLPAEMLEQVPAMAQEIQRFEGEVDEAWITGEKVLEGLALRLAELDQPSKSLSVARKIEQEDTRAWILKKTAPYLPQELLKEALAVAREIKWESSRAHALAGLLPSLPTDLRQECLAEALTAAREIKWESRRAYVLADLIPYLALDLREQVLREALAAARASRDSMNRSRDLTKIAPLFPKEKQFKVWKEALAAALTIEIEWNRSLVLEEIAPLFPEREQMKVWKEALAAVQAIEGEEQRLKALTALVPHLPSEFLSEALAVSQEIGSVVDKENALASLVSLVAKSGHLEEVLVLVREMKYPNCQAQALTSLIPYLPAELREQTLQEALVAARKDRWVSPQMWARLAAHLADLPQPILTHLLLEKQNETRLLHFLARSHRSDFLAQLDALVPVLVALGGLEAVNETFRAVQDVGRWWP